MRVLDQTDRLIRRLRPAVLDDLGLVEAVRTTGENSLVDSGISFHFEVHEGEETRLSRDLEVAVYRVFQEAMTNVLRHANAKSVRVELDIGLDLLRASVEDDGSGMSFSSNEHATDRPRWGLVGMRERIFQLNGSINFGPSDSGGVRIEFEVPLRPKEP